MYILVYGRSWHTYRHTVVIFKNFYGHKHDLTLSLKVLGFFGPERECDWCLHLRAVKLMMPYFFAAAHFNYARYGLYYLRKMETLPKSLLKNVGCIIDQTLQPNTMKVWALSLHTRTQLEDCLSIREILMSIMVVYYWAFQVGKLHR